MKLLTLLCLLFFAVLAPIAANSNASGSSDPALIHTRVEAGFRNANKSTLDVTHNLVMIPKTPSPTILAAGHYNIQAALAEVPEPQALVLLGIGLLVTARFLRKRDVVN